ncbi:hypothetical protein LPJ64_005672 [Coemansia asiatica]|uniref:Uncharacterized protein n=1 Tax=Coemansia asiatica TaxID=1052880 RepID=A0A9W8CGR2_9FUNG|nr:hypothetical protein LPJ64_005672 [Coemansia asiatica]KAJ2872004.1 hypothetical protein FB639_004399 [Coemansia asiatica]
MSSWSALSIAVPLGLGMSLAHRWFRSESIGWYNRLRKPRYNPPHRLLLPSLALIYVLQGISSYLAANEMILAQHTSEPVATRAGQLGLGFYWLEITFLIFWPLLISYESQMGSGWMLKLALVDLVVAVGFQFLAMVQFFRLSVIGGLVMLACFFALTTLGIWNAALVQKSGYLLPL